MMRWVLEGGYCIPTGAVSAAADSTSVCDRDTARMAQMYQVSVESEGLAQIMLDGRVG
jgi:hypothetical protein